MKKGILALLSCTLLFTIYTVLQFFKENEAFVRIETNLNIELDSINSQSIVPSLGNIRHRLEFVFDKKKHLNTINVKLLKPKNKIQHSNLIQAIEDHIAEIKSWPFELDFYDLNSDYLKATEKRLFVQELKKFIPAAQKLLKIEDQTKIDTVISKQIELYYQIRKDRILLNDQKLVDETLVRIKDFIAFLKSKAVSLNS